MPLTTQKRIGSAGLFRMKGRPEVYVKTKRGLEHIPSPEEFTKRGYRWEDVVDLPKPAFESLRKRYGIAQPKADLARQMGAPQIPPDITGTATRETDYRDLLLQQLQRQNEALSQYAQFLANQPSQTSLYRKYAEELGIPQKEKVASGFEKALLDLEGLLDNLEEDINARVRGRLVSEAQRRRMLAAEYAPLAKRMSALERSASRAKSGLSYARQRLADLLSAQQADIARQQQIAGLPLEYGMKYIPYYKEALTYETPAEKAKRELAERLALEKSLKGAGLDRYYQRPESATGGIGSAENPGGYTKTELKKLREAGIDPTNVEEADKYLYQKIRPLTTDEIRKYGHQYLLLAHMLLNQENPPTKGEILSAITPKIDASEGISEKDKERIKKFVKKNF